MDDLFSISVHHGGYFTENPKTYVGGEVDVVDNCNPDKWSKIEIERICRDFGYVSVSRLWYTMPGMDQERANFHLVVDDQDAMYMTELVKGHEEIHVYVEHPIDNPILVDEGEDVSEGVQPLAVEQGPMGYYSDGSDDDDHDGGEFYNFYDSDDMYANDQTFNKEDEPIEVDANDQTFNVDVATSQAGSRRVGKEPIIEHPPQVFIISDGSDSGCAGSGLDDEVELNHGVRDFVEDISDSWDDKDNDDDVVESSQMGASVMNSDYESEELHNLVESSSDDELGHDSDDDAMRDHDNAPSDFAGKDSHFFKNILDDTLCDQKLMIPKMFIRKYGENLSSPTFLKLPNGAKWKVELTYHNGEVWLQKGWKKFAECCSLKRGHLLVFKFENNSHFHTVIFDESGTEIDYPANRPNSNEQGKVDEECESESSDQILSDSPQHPKTRRSHKRKWEADSPQHPKTRRSHKRKWEALTGNDKAEALKKASGFKSKNPYFKVVMQPSFVKGWYMCVPVPFASQMYIQNGQEVMLKVGDQSWEVWFSIPKYRQRGSFSRGWSRFANENNLRVGDVCVFELIKSDDVVLKVSIFRV